MEAVIILNVVRTILPMSKFFPYNIQIIEFVITLLDEYVITHNSIIVTCVILFCMCDHTFVM